MGNTGSCEGPYAGVELHALNSPVVAIDQRFVRSQVTRMRLPEVSFSKNLSLKNVVSGKTEFRTGPKDVLEMFLDANKEPLVKVLMKEGISNIYYVYRHDGAPADSAAAASSTYTGTELLQIYVRQGLITKTGYLNLDLRVDFTDKTTGEHCRITSDGEWRGRSALLWLQRPGSTLKVPIGKVYRPPNALRNGFNIDFAPNLDIALATLVCAVVDDDLKRERAAANRLGFWA